MAEGLTENKNADGLKASAGQHPRTAGNSATCSKALKTVGWSYSSPQAPTPMSGNVMYLPTDRLRPLDISIIEAMAVVSASEPVQAICFVVSICD